MAYSYGSQDQIDAKLSASGFEEFEALTRPVIAWLNNLHPHHTVLITNTSAELTKGVMSYGTTDYVRD